MEVGGGSVERMVGVKRAFGSLDEGSGEEDELSAGVSGGAPELLEFRDEVERTLREFQDQVARAAEHMVHGVLAVVDGRIASLVKDEERLRLVRNECTTLQGRLTELCKMSEVRTRLLPSGSRDEEHNGE
mmetsp:Transcript_15749/g.31695  ORF Transcript_15749/g.31695 Transcript_15749/m.31695 type:complete len:130 (-) Transcript_15749:526-915(-)